MSDFPQCAYAAESVAPDLRRCTCARIAGQKLVSPALCAGCYFRHDEPAANHHAAFSVQPLPLWDCAQLGPPLSAASSTSDINVWRACHNGHGQTTRSRCGDCSDYVPPLVTPRTTARQASLWLSALTAQRFVPLQRDAWWEWPNIQAGFRLLIEAAIERLPAEQPNVSGRGIVIVGGGKYFPSAYVTIRVLRQVGCTLPIELWHFTGEVDERQRRVVETLDVQCIEVDPIAEQAGFRFHASWWKGWQLKPVAISRSRFAEVLYLDADCYPVRDPSDVFQWPGYRERGAVFWPDIDTSSFLFKPGSAAALGVPDVDDMPTESGQLLLDKRLCWRELQLALLLNEHADITYRLLWGDKDTFPLAWRRLGRRYARMWPTAKSHFPAILQYDHQGQVLFQHRTGDKFRLNGTQFDSNHQQSTTNLRVPGLEHEDFCFAALEDLSKALHSPPIHPIESDDRGATCPLDSGVTALPWPSIDWRSAWTEFEEHATVEERREIVEMFSILETIGTPTSSELFACSLFCRPNDVSMPWESPTAESVRQLRTRNGRMTWWEAYAAPLLENLRQLPRTFPECEAHVYLATDLEWLIPQLRLPNVVIHLMAHSSIAGSPGAMWRFLANDLPTAELIYTVDAEDPWANLPTLDLHLQRWRRSQLGLFRHLNPCEWSPDVERLLIYRPLVACHTFYRPRADFSAFESCCASVWLAKKGRFPQTMHYPQVGEVSLFGHQWPNYGFDESYLQHIFYPHFLPGGVYTHCHTLNSPVIFPLDVVATAQANPKSILAIAD